MDEFKACDLDYFPENILIDVLAYLSVRELVRAGRVCKRWKRLVKDQRLWRFVDLTAWKGHLQSLTSWERLSRLELRDTFRVTANGLRSCAAKSGVCEVEGLSRLKFLEIGITGRQGYQLQMASLGLGAGWLGLEELSLGGKEVGPGLLCASRLKDLKGLCLWACTLSEMQVVRSCRMLRGLSRMEFLDVTFQPKQCPPVLEGEGGGSGEEENNEDAAGAENSNDENNTVDMNNPIPSLRRSLAVLLPSCTLVFTNCSVQISAD
ncbi:uncharacterized protein LOC119210818 isoform X2 [Pungitius pungitius]|uniref:uncharacterized protein LOC119210818 isoform X2 n=1 Tax=Pungitius pungitius TaxID=134920 RepID=UPI0018894666|nr:uncharacterized protein LOC119210818 isoform X2 [Pungitius pungitius]